MCIRICNAPHMTIPQGTDAAFCYAAPNALLVHVLRRESNTSNGKRSIPSGFRNKDLDSSFVRFILIHPVFYDPAYRGTFATAQKRGKGLNALTLQCG